MTAPRRKIRAADLFCGAGGTSQGLLMAANELNADLELIAINHWDVAIDTHSVNHPYARHLCTGLDSVDPRKLVPGGRLNLMCASPECTHHSVARGGKPMNDQSRSSGWHILRFAEALYIDNLLIENVKEFQSWGPIDAKGRPMKSKRGQLFEQFIASLRALGYRVEWRVLNCADYGDPTTRRRLFIIARRGNKAIKWPEPTHVPVSTVTNAGLFAETRKPWRTAREIIDWSIPSKSIFERKRPLADKTLARIQAGLKKFCGLDVDLKRCFAEDLRPFIVVLRGTGTTASVDDPLQTVTASGNHYGLVEPFLAQWDQTGSEGGKQRSIDDPCPTVVTKANTGLVEPFFVQAGGPEGKGREPRSVSEPLATVVAENHTGLVQPFVMPHPREHDQPQSVDVPVRTVTASSNDFSLVEPFIVPQFGVADPRSVERPLGTVTTTSRGVGLVEPSLPCTCPTECDCEDPDVDGVAKLSNECPVHNWNPRPSPDCLFHNPPAFMVTLNHGDGDTTRRAQSVNEPLPTATSKMAIGICEPFLIAYYGTQNMSEAGEPLPTITTKERFGLVEAEVTRYRLDIRFRMLQPRELARAQGFPDEYKFTGNREAVVKQIGNAVPPNTAKALILEAIA